MKKEYTQPELIEYGTVEQLTLGSTGQQLDMLFIGGALVPADPANCGTNGPPMCVTPVAS